MHASKHAKTRQSQRGISNEMIAYAIEHGTDERIDRIVFGRKEAIDRLNQLKEEERLLMKILDKGGVVVVADGESIITTYNCTRRKH